MIFLRIESAEHGHDTVALDPDDRAFEAMDGFLHDADGRGQPLRCGFRIEPLDQIRRALEVGEKDRDVLELGIGARQRNGLGRREQRSATLGTKASWSGIDVAAGRASAAQRNSARNAEPCIGRIDCIAAGAAHLVCLSVKFMLLFSRKQEQAVVIDSPPNFDDLRPRATWLRRRAETLLARFQRSFPAIRYDLAWYSDSVNAQAFLKRKRQWVRLYGGLARHRRITIAGIAYAIAHETGHHLGGAPFDPTYSWLSSESRADEWAIRDGLIQLFGTEKGPSLATQGLRELIALAPADDVGRARRERLLQGEMVERQGFSTDH